MIATLSKAPWMRDEPKLARYLLHLALAASSIKFLPIHARQPKASSILCPGQLSKPCRPYGHHSEITEKKSHQASGWNSLTSGILPWVMTGETIRCTGFKSMRLSAKFARILPRLLEQCPKLADVSDCSIGPKTACGFEKTRSIARRSKTQSSLHLGIKPCQRAATPSTVNVGPLAEGLSCVKTRVV